MGFNDAVRRALGRKAAATIADLPGAPPVWFNEHLIVDQVLGMGVEELWRTQPYLRTVVTFMARNVAQLGLHTFQRVSETDRRRVRDNPVALLLARPNATTTGYELVYGLVADLALYDRAYWLIADDASSASGFGLTRIPPAWVVRMNGGTVFAPASYTVQRPDGSAAVTVPADRVLAFHGWAPDSLRVGSSPVDALKQILAEQVSAMTYRQQVWARGGRVATVLNRPPGSTWTPEQAAQFKKDWRGRWSGDGSDAGGTPILEDGMTLQRVGFSAHEDEFVDSAKLALTVVASVYHLNPTMIGLLDSANYSNVREFRRMMYGDSLGPIMAQIEDRLNTFLVPQVTSEPGVYVEFNIAEKLQGNFEEQAQAIQSATGAPWMLRSEARAMMNLPHIGGSDDLVVPLNVLVGGQASPTDSAPKSVVVSRSGVAVKARASQSLEDQHTAVVRRFFRRQSEVVRTALGAKGAADWWDRERWDRELADDLYRLALLVSTQVAAETLESIGFDPSEYDSDRTLAWLREVSQRSAASINAATKAQIDDALTADDPKAAVASVYDVAEGQRAPALTAVAVTLLSAFATHEAAKQVAGDKATKTWVTGSNPRPAHAAMNGQTVALSENFSNGAAWPGDGSALDADDLAGCNCSLRINV